MTANPPEATGAVDPVPYVPVVQLSILVKVSEKIVAACEAEPIKSDDKAATRPIRSDVFIGGGGDWVFVKRDQQTGFYLKCQQIFFETIEIICLYQA